ncbi:MAG TPA: FliH/SctL family protein [Rhizomicrobium sp.]
MNTTKYTFDVEFREEGDLVSNAARARQKKAYSHAEIDQLSARARAEGMKAGQVRAQDAIAGGIETMIAALRAALAATHDEIETVRADATAIAIAAAHKLAKAALAALPEAEVESALREAMHQAIGEPRILLRTAPKVAEAISPRLAEIAQDEGFDGRVQISADPHLTGTDCRVEWRGGGAERTESAISAALNDLITRHFAEGVRTQMTEE